MNDRSEKTRQSGLLCEFAHMENRNVGSTSSGINETPNAVGIRRPKVTIGSHFPRNTSLPAHSSSHFSSQHDTRLVRDVRLDHTCSRMCEDSTWEFCERDSVIQRSV